MAKEEAAGEEEEGKKKTYRRGTQPSLYVYVYVVIGCMEYETQRRRGTEEDRAETETEQ